MSEKPGIAQIREEIAAERQRLDGDLDALQAEFRSLGRWPPPVSQLWRS
jgi:Protein of unknown function (DUF3618).